MELRPNESEILASVVEKVTVGGLLEETKTAFEAVKGCTLVAMQRLHQVHATEAWKAVADSFGAYVEGELGISQSFASKLLSVAKHYLVQGNLSPDKLAGIDYESLYLAKKLAGTVEEQLAKAETLSRAELKAENVDDGHVHSGELVTIHKCCGMRA